MKGIVPFIAGILFTWPILCQSPSVRECAGTAMPYPAVTEYAHFCPDTLVPFYINHIGRHGARFPTSDGSLKRVLETLVCEEQVNNLTNTGKELLLRARDLYSSFAGHWGMLSDLGVREQRGIAGRMARHFPGLFSDSARISAIATYVPRCIVSMKSFLEVLSKEHPSLRIRESEGHQYNQLLRFFDLNASYVEYKRHGDWKRVYETFVCEKIDPEPVMRLFFFRTPSLSDPEKRSFVMALFAVAAILPDTGVAYERTELFSYPEWLDYWQTQNLRQYLSKSSAPVGRMLPVAIAWPLLADFIATTDSAVNGWSDNRVNLRFAHAETVIPFAALMGIKAADAQIAQPDSVALVWRDYRIAPMAANIQWIFYRDPAHRVWVQFLLNEEPVALSVPSGNYPYYLWEEIRVFFDRQVANARDMASFKNCTD